MPSSHVPFSFGPASLLFRIDKKNQVDQLTCFLSPAVLAGLPMFRRELRFPWLCPRLVSNLLIPLVMTVQGPRNIVEARVHPFIEAVSHDAFCF